MLKLSVSSGASFQFESIPVKMYGFNSSENILAKSLPSS